MVVNDFKDVSDLPAVPGTYGSQVAGWYLAMWSQTEGISQIYTAIDQALKIVGLSDNDEFNLMKLVIPRFLFLAPCRDELGREVAGNNKGRCCES